MGLTKDCAPHIANIVFGCAALAFAPIGGTAAGVLSAVASLGATVGLHFNTAKPDNKKRIERLIKKHIDEARERIKAENRSKYERGQILTRTENALFEFLPQINFSREQLAADARAEGGFAKAATRRVVAALSEIEAEQADEDALLFHEEHGAHLARELTSDIFNAVFELARTDREYFEALEPHLILGISEGVGDLKRGQAEQGEQLDRIERLLESAQNPGVPQNWLIDMARLINRDISNFDDAKREFEQTLPELVKVYNAKDRASNLYADLAAILAKVREQSLNEGRVTLEDTLARYDTELDEERRARKEQERLLVLDTLVEQYTALREPDKVAEAELRKIALTYPESDRFDAARRLHINYYESGERYAVRINLQIAIALARRYGEHQNPNRRAIAQIDLGNALNVLGRRGQEGALQDAVTAFRAALDVYTREAAPMDWAMTQNNLGSALHELGTRGQDGALQDAVTAYRAALDVYTREAAPMNWAMTQENLVIIYAIIADAGQEAHQHLELALIAIQGALEVFRASDAPYYIDRAETLEARLKNRLAALKSAPDVTP